MKVRSFVFGYTVGFISGCGVLGFWYYSILTASRNMCNDCKRKSDVLSQIKVGHDAVLALPVKGHMATFKEKVFHNDDDSVARKLYDQVRVLCWVMTSETNLQKKARHVRATWGRRCNKLLFVSDHRDDKFPTIDVKVKKGRKHLTTKTMKAFEYIYKHHYDDADWFLKADDDTYVIVENLRYFLSSKNTSEPVFFGHLFKLFVPQGYYSGGGGYVLSHEALRRFGTRKANLCAKDNADEDVEMGRCMHRLGVKTSVSRDVLGRSLFHCFNSSTHVNGRYLKWYHRYIAGTATQGIDSISDYAITFHYISPQQMYELDFLVYHLAPYGIVRGLQSLNSDHPTGTVRPQQHGTS